MGLYVIELAEHYVVSEKGFVITDCRNYEDGEKIIQTIKDITDWSTFDVFIKLEKQEEKEIVRAVKKVREEYGIAKEKNERKKIGMYKIKTGEQRENRVGYSINEGLYLTKEKNGCYFLDIPVIDLRFTLSVFYHEALDVAQKVKGEFNFKNPSLDIKKVKSKVEEVIERKKEEKDFYLLFQENEKIKENWGLFKKTWDEIQEMTGLKIVKEEISKLVYKVKGEIELGNSAETRDSMHMIFHGNAGTGKTEIARLLTDILFSLGYIKERKCIEVDRSKIVSNYIGETEKKMNNIIQQSLDGVLFIDEAYALNKEGKDYGKEAVETLMKAMEDKRDRILVIAAGYTTEMEEFLNMNPGLRSRFKYYMLFPDYELTEFVKILYKNIVKYKIEPEKKSGVELAHAVKRLEKNGKVEGNARTARNLSEKIIDEYKIRIGREGKEANRKILAEDIKRATGLDKKINEHLNLHEIRERSLRELEHLIGLEDLKAQAKKFINVATIHQLKKEQGIFVTNPRFHMFFKGSPGTGKTTVARIMGEFFKGCGILSRGHFIEAKRVNLVGKYQGHTAEKTMKLLNEAEGGILFIDEAYSLYKGENDTFGQEAIDLLIAEMENRKNNLIVIFAGYEKDMEHLLTANSGFSSRIGYQFEFTDYNKEEIKEITHQNLKKLSLFYDENVKKEVNDFIEKTNEFDGNARWAVKFADYIHQEQNNRLAEEKRSMTKEELTLLKKEDVKNAFHYIKTSPRTETIK